MANIKAMVDASICRNLYQMQQMELQVVIESIEWELMWDQFIYYCNTGRYPYVADINCPVKKHY